MRTWNLNDKDNWDLTGCVAISGYELHDDKQICTGIITGFEMLPHGKIWTGYEINSCKKWCSKNPLILADSLEDFETLCNREYGTTVGKDVLEKVKEKYKSMSLIRRWLVPDYEYESSNCLGRCFACNHIMRGHYIDTVYRAGFMNCEYTSWDRPDDDRSKRPAHKPVLGLWKPLDDLYLHPKDHIECPYCHTKGMIDSINRYIGSI